MTVRLEERHLLRTLGSFPVEIQQDRTSRTFYLSLAIVRHYLGAEWADEYVQDNGTGGYVRLDWDSRHQEQAYRIVDLAELLLNLQHVSGFDECVRRMRLGDIEGTYAELDFGRMLFQSEIDFKFVRTTGRKGDDYDIEILLADGTVVCADAKCKIEATEYSERTVLHSLQHARTQFPQDKPSVIFVKLPPRWNGERPTLKADLARVASNFLRGTGRVVSVKYYISHIFWNNGIISHIQAFDEINNNHPSNRFGRDRNWDMFVEANTFDPNLPGGYSDVPKCWRHLINFNG